METYLREFARTLRLDPDETRAIVAEVRGNLEDMVTHLHAQGYSPDDAEEEAIRRFDEAGGLARALHRAHRRAPLLLRALALLVAVSGLAALLLALYFVRTVLAADAHHALMLSLGLPNPTRPRFWMGLSVTLVNTTPILVPALVAVASLCVGWLVLRGQRRRHWRRIGVGVLSVAVLDGALVLAVASTIPRGAAPAVALPEMVPNGGALVAAGLTGQPARGQPGSPVTVDRVLADTTATYVQYRILDVPDSGQPVPALLDDRGRVYRDESSSSAYRPVDQLLPWRPAEVHLAQFAPLHSDARAAVLRFSYGGRVVETVRVTLNLGALRRAARTSHPGVTTTVHGFRATLISVTSGVAVAKLSYAIDPPRGLVRAGQGVSSAGIESVVDARGRQLSQEVIGTWSTRCIPWNRPLSCTWTTIGLPFASAPSGTHLTLTITTLDVNGPGRQDRLVHGAWRLPFVMP